MATATRVRVDPGAPTAVALTPLRLIDFDADKARGVTPCQTCRQGYHAYSEEGDKAGYPWTACDNCNARALNNAQISDTNTVMANDGQALIGACMGARKTGTSVAIMNQYRGVWLIVAPLHTLDQWSAAIREWAPAATVHTITAKNKTGLIDLKEDAGTFSIHLIGWEYLRRQDLTRFQNIDGVIADEVHRMSGHKTATFRAVKKINSTRRIALSGTPANNKMHALWNVLNWIWWGNKGHKNPNIFRRFYLYMGDDSNPGWIRRHFWLLPKPHFNGVDTGFDIGPEKVVGTVISEVPCYIQHLEDETCCEWHPGGVNASLPEAEEPTVIYTDMSPAQAKLYREVDDEKTTIVWLEKVAEAEEAGAIAPTMVGEGLVERMRLRQIALAVPALGETTFGPDGKPHTPLIMKEDAASSKIDALLDLLPDIVEDGDPVLVLTHSKVFAKIVTARINKKFPAYAAAEWSGDVKPAVREGYKTTVGTPEGPQVIVAVIQSIAEGTDGLQLMMRREVWLSWDDNMMLNTQMRSRLRRTGQKRRGQRWDIVTKGTIEERQIKALKANKIRLDDSLKAR